MGYTNYWTQTRSFTNDEWKKVKDEYEWLKEMGEGIIVDQSENKDELSPDTEIFEDLLDLEEDSLAIDSRSE